MSSSEAANVYSRAADLFSNAGRFGQSAKMLKVIWGYMGIIPQKRNYNVLQLPVYSYFHYYDICRVWLKHSKQKGIYINQ